MPRKRIGIIPYQPAYFHIISPNAEELADGYQEFAAAAYDQYRNTCFKYGPEFCQLAELDDTLHLQWKASDATNNFSPSLTWKATAELQQARQRTNWWTQQPTSQP